MPEYAALVKPTPTWKSPARMNLCKEKNIQTFHRCYRSLFSSILEGETHHPPPKGKPPKLTIHIKADVFRALSMKKVLGFMKFEGNDCTFLILQILASKSDNEEH
jgi:hypothetical protein